MYSVTVSEWKSVHKRLDDLESIVKKLQSKSELNGNGHQKNQNSNVETQDSVESDRMEMELNTHSNIIPANLPDSDPSSTVVQQSLTLTPEVSGPELVTTSSRILVHASTSVMLTEKPILAPAPSTSTSSFCQPIGIGVDDQNAFEKDRRAVILLKRCDETDVLAPRPSLGLKNDENKKNKATANSVKRTRQLNEPRKSTGSTSHEKRKGKFNGSAVSIGEKQKRCKRLISTRKFTTKDSSSNLTNVRMVKKPYTCHVCAKEFKYKCWLIVHLRLHTGERPYTCHFCPKVFNTNYDLKRHMSVHTGEKPYLCQFCSKCFSHQSPLKLHILNHTGEKPYACHVCTKRYRLKCSLIVHLRVHTGEKPYRCQFCSKCFSCRGNLTSHTHVHTGEKPYSCQYCPKTYAHQNNLKSHLKTHTLHQGSQYF